MPYRVMLIHKSGERETRDVWTSQRRTPVIGEVIELPIDTRMVRAIVKGIARAPADRSDADALYDVIIAKEI
jgi:hypothetical protein